MLQLVSTNSNVYLLPPAEISTKFAAFSTLPTKNFPNSNIPDGAAAAFPHIHETIQHRGSQKRQTTADLDTGVLPPKSDIMMNVSHRKPASRRENMQTATNKVITDMVFYKKDT